MQAQFMVDTGAVCSVIPHRSKRSPTGTSAFWRRREGHSVLGEHPPPPNVRAPHFFCHLFARRRQETNSWFRFLVRPRAAGQPIRPPGAGLEVSETALLTDNRRRDPALQIRRRPLLHSTVGMVPVGFVPSHCRQRERKTIAKTQDPPHHRDDGPPCVRQGLLPGPGQAAPGRSRAPPTGGGRHHPPIRFTLVVAPAHGPQERRVVTTLRRLPPTQPGDDTRLLSPSQHP